MCYPCQKSHHHAQGHPTSMPHSWRDLRQPPSSFFLTTSWPFSGPTNSSKMGVISKSYRKECCLFAYYLLFSCCHKSHQLIFPHATPCKILEIYISLLPFLLCNILCVPPLMPPFYICTNNFNLKI